MTKLPPSIREALKNLGKFAEADGDPSLAELSSSALNGNERHLYHCLGVMIENGGFLLYNESHEPIRMPTDARMRSKYEKAAIESLLATNSGCCVIFGNQRVYAA